MTVKKRPARFHVGDRIQFDLVRRRLTGVVTETRGALGPNGQHLYQVQVPLDPDEAMTLELLEDEMQAADLTPPAHLEKHPILAFLNNGGLVAILHTNLAGGRQQPRVWLTRDTLGNVTYTFAEDRGLVGGAPVPFWAIQDDKIFKPKQKEVIAFLQSFGLDRAEAEAIVAAVGTAP